MKRITALASLITAIILLASCSLPAPEVTPPSPTFTDTPEITLTASDTPLPSATFTPELVSITVSVDTNCRTGPGQVYDMVGGLMVGEIAQVLAVDPSGEFWYIANPDGTGYCWVWGQYATVVGDTSPLPVYTPLPTPTPVIDFKIYFQALDQCMAMRYTRLKLQNTGVLTWESFKATITDLTTAETSSPMESDNFIDATSCGEITNVPLLAPGDSAVVHTYGFNHDLPGHNLRADVTVCSNNGLTGTCVTREINFTP